MKILCIAVPEGMSADDVAVVPKVATDEMLRRSANLYGDWIVEMVARYEELLAAAPEVKVCDLPGRIDIDRLPFPDHTLRESGFNECLDEIEQRLK